MKKIRISILLFFMFSVNIFALSIDDFVSIEGKKAYIGIYDMRCCIEFLEDSFIDFTNYGDNSKQSIWNNTFHYELIEDNGLLLLQFNFKEVLQKYLVLISDDYLILYDTFDSSLFFWGTTKVRGSTEGFSTFKDNISATSELHEGSQIYMAKNMSSFDLDAPWVEGKKGYGIGEKIFLPYGNNSITICSGYLSVKKPWLWKQNSRPKVLCIYSKKTGLSTQFKLKDTPMPQTFYFDNSNTGNVEITILDVYKGTKYDDTCIHMIMSGAQK